MKGQQHINHERSVARVVLRLQMLITCGWKAWSNMSNNQMSVGRWRGVSAEWWCVLVCVKRIRDEGCRQNMVAQRSFSFINLANGWVENLACVEKWHISYSYHTLEIYWPWNGFSQTMIIRRIHFQRWTDCKNILLHSFSINWASLIPVSNLPCPPLLYDTTNFKNYSGVKFKLSPTNARVCINRKVTWHTHTGEHFNLTIQEFLYISFRDWPHV